MEHDYADVVRTIVAMRISQFDALPAQPDSVIFVGDSLVENGLWAEWFPEYRVVNRGVMGNTIADLHNRLDFIGWDDATAVVVVVGTNDLGDGARVDSRGIADRFRQLTTEILKRAPSAPVLVCGILPREERFAQAITRINESYREHADQPGIWYVDPWPALVDETTSALRSDYTLDGLHLTGRGYQALVRVLRAGLVSALDQS